MKGLEHHAPMVAPEQIQYHETPDHHRVSSQRLPCSEASNHCHDEEGREIIPIRLDPDKHATEEMWAVK